MSAAAGVVDARGGVDAGTAKRVLARPAAPAVVFLAILIVIFGVTAPGSSRSTTPAASSPR